MSEPVVIALKQVTHPVCISRLEGYFLLHFFTWLQGRGVILLFLCNFTGNVIFLSPPGESVRGWEPVNNPGKISNFRAHDWSSDDSDPCPIYCILLILLIRVGKFDFNL